MRSPIVLCGFCVKTSGGVETKSTVHFIKLETNENRTNIEGERKGASGGMLCPPKHLRQTYARDEGRSCKGLVAVVVMVVEVSVPAETESGTYLIDWHSRKGRLCGCWWFNNAKVRDQESAAAAWTGDALIGCTGLVSAGSAFRTLNPSHSPLIVLRSHST